MRILRRLKHWWRFDANSSELEAELSFHRETIERDLIARGYSTAEARDAARRTMGNETLMREEARGVWMWPPLEAVWQDMGYAGRSIRRAPGFVSLVAIALVLGIGVNTATFAVLDEIYLRPPAGVSDAAAFEGCGSSTSTPAWRILSSPFRA